MPDSPSLQDLVSRWRDLRKRGQPVDLEALCAGRPELLPELRRKVEALAEMEVFLDTGLPQITPHPPVSSEPTTETQTAPPRPKTSETPVFGDFRLLRKLGEGGMGVVYEAEEGPLRRRVALKIMRSQVATNPESRERFMREARAMAAVEHERIIPIHRVGEGSGPDSPIPYLVMPLLRGESLGNRLRRTPKLPVVEAMAIGKQIADGLAAAHAAGLIHRDVKPDNVWLEGESPDCRVKLLDFGLARAAEPEALLSRPGAVMGTPAYMAPEQAAGQDVDARADLFSLGVVLYEMTTGRRPFQGGSAMSVLSQIANHNPPPPHEVDAMVPEGLSRLVMRLLAKKPVERPTTARAVVEAIAALEGGTGTPSTVEPPPGWRQSGNRKSRGCAITIVITIASLVVAVMSQTMSWKGELQRDTSSATPPTTGPLRGDVDVQIWDETDAGRQDIFLNDVRALPLKAGDRFAVTAKMERPAYVYIVWIRSTGKVEPVYPWTPGKWDSRPAEEQPVTSLRRPESRVEFYKLPQGNPGMETLVLLARETPLPADVDLKAELGGFDKQTEQNIRSRVWIENGEVLKGRPGRDPEFFTASRLNDPVLEAQQRVTDVARKVGFSYTLAVSFANQGK